MRFFGFPHPLYINQHFFGEGHSNGKNKTTLFSSVRVGAAGLMVPKLRNPTLPLSVSKTVQKGSGGTGGRAKPLKNRFFLPPVAQLRLGRPTHHGRRFSISFSAGAF